MQSSYLAKRFFDGVDFHDNALVNVFDGRIESVQANYQGSADQTLDGLLTAGFVDVQVNGGGGVLFNRAPRMASLQTIMAAHARFGTTAMTPTLITDDVNVMQEAANATAEAIEAGIPGILGVHFEGPHLSVPKRGIHQTQHIRAITDKELALFCRKDLGKVVVTLAPENVPVDVIKNLVDEQVLVCLGHSNADADTVMAALEAGAQGFTHLYNAMSPLTSRAPGMVGCALLHADSYCGLIVDHHHVHPLSSQLAIRCKGAERIMLVTDAMAHVGTDAQALDYFDTQIIRQGDKLVVPEGSLAGSVLDMAGAVRNSHRDLGVALADALIMASLTPSSFLGLQEQTGRLTPGRQADMVLLDDNLEVMGTWIKGQPVYSQQAQ